jgi:hypothetical protein
METKQAFYNINTRVITNLRFHGIIEYKFNRKTKRREVVSVDFKKLLDLKESEIRGWYACGKKTVERIEQMKDQVRDMLKSWES